MDIRPQSSTLPSVCCTVMEEVNVCEVNVRFMVLWKCFLTVCFKVFLQVWFWMMTQSLVWQTCILLTSSMTVCSCVVELVSFSVSVSERKVLIGQTFNFSSSTWKDKYLCEQSNTEIFFFLTCSPWRADGCNWTLSSRQKRFRFRFLILLLWLRLRLVLWFGLFCGFRL